MPPELIPQQAHRPAAYKAAFSCAGNTDGAAHVTGDGNSMKVQVGNLYLAEKNGKIEAGNTTSPPGVTNRCVDLTAIKKLDSATKEACASDPNTSTKLVVDGDKITAGQKASFCKALKNTLKP